MQEVLSSCFLLVWHHRSKLQALTCLIKTVSLFSWEAASALVAYLWILKPGLVPAQAHRCTLTAAVALQGGPEELARHTLGPWLS